MAEESSAGNIRDGLPAATTVAGASSALGGEGSDSGLAGEDEPRDVTDTLATATICKVWYDTTHPEYRQDDSTSALDSTARPYFD